MRARGKKKACRALFLVVLITTVLSPRAASLQSSHKISLILLCHMQGPRATKGVGALPPPAAVSAPGRTNV